MPSGARPEVRIDENVGFGAGLHALAGTSSEALAEEAQRMLRGGSLPTMQVVSPDDLC